MYKLNITQLIRRLKEDEKVEELVPNNAEPPKSSISEDELATMQKIVQEVGLEMITEDDIEKQINMDEAAANNLITYDIPILAASSDGHNFSLSELNTIVNDIFRFTVTPSISDPELVVHELLPVDGKETEFKNFFSKYGELKKFRIRLRLNNDQKQVLIDGNICFFDHETVSGEGKIICKDSSSIDMTMSLVMEIQPIPNNNND